MVNIPGIKKTRGKTAGTEKNSTNKNKNTAEQEKTKADDKKNDSKATPATSPNTISTVYLDTFNKKVCVKDRAAVVKECTPEHDDDEKESKDKKKSNSKKSKTRGLNGKLAEAAKTIDAIGKKSTGYVKDINSKTAFDGTAWMDDGCTGAWVTPHDKPDGETIKDEINKMFEEIKNNRLSMLFSALDTLKGLALEAAKAAAEDLIQKFLIKTGIKIAAGAVFCETIFMPILMASLTVADIIYTASQLAVLPGPKGKAAYDAMVRIKDIGEEADKIMAEYKTKPHKAQADAMSLMAQINSCMRARKCLLIPYKLTSPDGVRVPGATDQNKATAQARHGNGCCPGQTGHHIIPDAMMENVKCSAYNYDEAPTICLEGTKNGFKHGSHGKAHEELSKSIKTYKGSQAAKNLNKDLISYTEAKKQGIDAVEKAGAAHCDRKCLEAQLDQHYGSCDKEMLNANAGTGSPVKARPAEPEIIAPKKRTKKP
ncbi:hypothetical protein [Massilia sp. CCM 8734]|uniref:hypothetical protein n=1 Tax=Massilia sp. CCM 8734 TaxID=2609283 RepID=UPI001420E3BB|nr:hypothetical protein [Massilia sp. CCM 8734]NIA00927.1 hypothetical protein [Massilia sp. CCM 8734]